MSDEETTSGGGGGGGGVDLGVIGGIVLAFAGIIGGLYYEGSSVGKYVGPSAAMIVFGGTFGATLTSVGLTRFKRIPGSFMHALRFTPPDRIASIKTLVKFAEKARREGLLVLEEQLAEEPDEFMRRGLQLVVDGTDPDLVAEILATEIAATKSAETNDAKIWETMGGFSPTMGIIGTVIGLVLVLSNISDPASLAGAIAVAFIATLYGVSSANLIFLPIGNKLTSVADEASKGRELVMEGVLAIQSGDNPRVVEEKLTAYLPPNLRAQLAAEKADDGFDL